jgi:hypothetical protein
LENEEKIKAIELVADDDIESYVPFNPTCKNEGAVDDICE